MSLSSEFLEYTDVRPSWKTGESKMNTLPTQVPELNDVLLELIGSSKEILGTNFLAAYLQGSFALGDWDLHSDVDFLIVLKDEIPESLLPQLQAMHKRIYVLPSVWAQHLEGSYITQKVLRENKTDVPLWYLDNGSQTTDFRYALQYAGDTLHHSRIRNCLGWCGCQTPD